MAQEGQAQWVVHYTTQAAFYANEGSFSAPSFPLGRGDQGVDKVSQVLL
jgi:hypothetical protein